MFHGGKQDLVAKAKREIQSRILFMATLEGSDKLRNPMSGSLPVKVKNEYRPGWLND